jgi:hypothetical protein
VDAAADPFEGLYARGVTDGLPVIPPTRERVGAAVAASGRAGDALIALVPPNFGRATVEKIAVNAVMAGCRPEYMPVVIAGVEAMCDDAFDLHGVSATTNSAAPLFIVNGPVRTRLEMNAGAGVFGPGYRANATIGRALRLIVRNLGGAVAGGITMSTMAHPGYFTYCIAEREEESPWAPLSVRQGFAPGDSTVSAFAAYAPQVTYDHQSHRGEDLLITLIHTIAVMSHHKSTHHGDTLLVVSPEHARLLAGDGWDPERISAFLWDRLRKPVKDLIPGVNGGEGLPARVLKKFPHPAIDTTLIAKVREPGNFKLMVAGGTAGRFTAVVAGWTFPKMSRMVTKRIDMAGHRGPASGGRQ